MSPTSAPAALLHPAEAAQTAAALARALDGGPPVAPLPDDPVERRAALDALWLDEPITEADAAAVVLTSGSTGAPKGVVLSRGAIRASAAATHARLGGPGDWLLALPAHYVAGLMVLARAHEAGTRVLPVGTDLHGLAALPAPDGRRRYLSVVPTQLRRALADPVTTNALRRLDAVLVGGASCPPALLEQAVSADIAVVTTYGMTETCGGCVYDGVPLDRVDVVLGPDGRVEIGGPTVFSGYRPATGAALREGRFRTADRARWESDGRLQVLGRVDDVVISGGLNVDLAAVERQAGTWPALPAGAELVVVGVPHPEWGTEVVAVTSVAVTIEGLRTYLRPTLPPYAAPRRLVRVATLPRTSGGKIDRQRVLALARSGQPDEEATTA